LGNFGRRLGLGESADSVSALFGGEGFGGIDLGALSSVFFVANTSTSFIYAKAQAAHCCGTSGLNGRSNPGML